MMISYAQQFEDVMLWRALKGVSKGTYIDIGANDPVIDSVSLLFYENGWRGMHVEPMPGCAVKLREARPDEDVLEAAVGGGKEELTLFSFEGTGLTTAVAEHARRHQEDGRQADLIKVPCLPLSEIFEQFNRRHVHWLKVDVEGMEKTVLESWGDHPTRPWIVIVESTLPNSQDLAYEDWEHELTGRDYEFVYFDGLNRFYVHAQHADLKEAFSTPPNFFDRFFLSEHSPFSGHVAGKWYEARTAAGRLQTELDQLVAEHETVRAKLDEISKTLDRVEGERTSLSGLADARLVEIERLEHELEQLQAHHQIIDEARLHLERHVATIEPRVAEADRLAEELAHLKSHHEATDAARLHLERHIATIEPRVAEADRLAEELAHLKSHHEATDAARLHLERHVAAIEVRLTESHEAAAQARSLAESIQMALQSSESIREQLVNERDTLLASLEDLRTRFDVAQQDVQTYQADIAAQKEEAEETLARQSEQHAERVNALEEMTRALQADMHALTHQLAQSEQHGTGLQHELDNWRAEAFAYRDQSREVFNSASWKLSAPVRWAGSGARGSAGLVKAMLRPVIGGSLELARANPWMKRPILAAANLAPPVRRKIDHFASVRAPERPPNNLVRTEAWKIAPDSRQVAEWNMLLSSGKNGRSAIN